MSLGSQRKSDWKSTRPSASPLQRAREGKRYSEAKCFARPHPPLTWITREMQCRPWHRIQPETRATKFSKLGRVKQPLNELRRPWSEAGIYSARALPLRCCFVFTPKPSRGGACSFPSLAPPSESSSSILKNGKIRHPCWRPSPPNTSRKGETLG